MSDFTFQLAEPAYIRLEIGEGQFQRIDVYEARQMLAAAANSPDEAHQHNKVLDWLAERLGIPRERLARNNAIDFNNAVAAIVARLADDRKKKVESIACSPDITPASLPTSASGP